MYHINVLILAAGKGERMGAISREIPKPAHSIRGRAILSRLLDSLMNISTLNIDRIVINVSHQPHYIINIVSDECMDLKDKISFFFEREALGSARTIQLLSRKHPAAWLVIHGDLVWDEIGFKKSVVNMLKATQHCGMLIHPRMANDARSIVLIQENNWVHGFQENPSVNGSFEVMVNSGVYFFGSNLEKISLGRFPGKSIPECILPQLASERVLQCFPSYGERQSIETYQDLELAQEKFRNCF